MKLVSLQELALGDKRFTYPRPSRRSRREYLTLLAVLLGAALLWLGYALSAHPVSIEVEGRSYPLHLHRLTVEAALQEANLSLQPEDIIDPPPGTELNPGQVIHINLARPVSVEADGRSRQIFTQQRDLPAVLAEAGVKLGDDDELWLNGAVYPTMANLPAAPIGNPASPLLNIVRPPTLQLRVQRAVPLLVNDGGIALRFYTTRPTISQALTAQGITLFPEDDVRPPLDEAVTPGMNVFIQRSVPITIRAGGREFQTRTLRQNVQEALAEAGAALMGQDKVSPPLDTPIQAGMTIRLTRVEQSLEIKSEPIAFETRYQPDGNLELDTRQVLQKGVSGQHKQRFRITYEDGQEVERKLEDDWAAEAPREEVIAYGTKVVMGELQTEQGVLSYWRKLRMLATSYSAASAGKSPDHPRYGITRTGIRVDHGVVAIDTNVMMLGTPLYVQDYGQAIAADTGGGVVGRRIDLGFPDDNTPLIYKWVDVYLIGPPPAEDAIRYVLPDWPIERKRR